MAGGGDPFGDAGPIGRDGDAEMRLALDDGLSGVIRLRPVIQSQSKGKAPPSDAPQDRAENGDVAASNGRLGTASLTHRGRGNPRPARAAPPAPASGLSACVQTSMNPFCRLAFRGGLAFGHDADRLRPRGIHAQTARHRVKDRPFFGADRPSAMCPLLRPQTLAQGFQAVLSKRGNRSGIRVNSASTSCPTCGL